MKESILGPRQWAFVVITGGAACALPFVHSDNSPTSIDSPLTRTDSGPTPTDSALTSSPQGSAPGDRFALESSGAAGGALVVPGSIADIAPHLSHQRLPEWANADRSPFDELVGVTASKPQTEPPSEQVPMQPLRPWIAGPADVAALASTVTPPGPASANVAGNSIAGHHSSAAAATPWNDEPTKGFTPIEQLAHSSSNAPRKAVARLDDKGQWPDQTVSAEELAQATRLRERELASSIVASPQIPAGQSSALLAAPALPAAPSSAAITTMPVATQRFGQAYLPPGSPAPQTTTFGQPTVRADAPSSDSNLPSLPPTRKSHIIFQPGNWK